MTPITEYYIHFSRVGHKFHFKSIVNKNDDSMECGTQAKSIIFYGENGKYKPVWNSGQKALRGRFVKIKLFITITK